MDVGLTLEMKITNSGNQEYFKGMITQICSYDRHD